MYTYTHKQFHVTTMLLSFLHYSVSHTLVHCAITMKNMTQCYYLTSSLYHVRPAVRLLPRLISLLLYSYSMLAVSTNAFFPPCQRCCPDRFLVSVFLVNTTSSKKRKVIGFFVLQHPLGNLALNALPKGTKALSTIWGLNWHSATRPHLAPVATWERSAGSCSFCVKLIELYYDSFRPPKLPAGSLVSTINMQRQALI